MEFTTREVPVDDHSNLGGFFRWRWLHDYRVKNLRAIGIETYLEVGFYIIKETP